MCAVVFVMFVVCLLFSGSTFRRRGSSGYVRSSLKHMYAVGEYTVHVASCFVQPTRRMQPTVCVTPNWALIDVGHVSCVVGQVLLREYVVYGTQQQFPCATNTSSGIERTD